jgi:hypothetical protein
MRRDFKNSLEQIEWSHAVEQHARLSSILASIPDDAPSTRYGDWARARHAELEAAFPILKQPIVS